MSTVKNYLSLVKFSHTIFAMPFALIGFFLGRIFDAFIYGHTVEPEPVIGWRVHRGISDMLFRYLPLLGLVIALHGLCPKCGHGL